MGITFHFLNVGSGDCTIVHFPQRRRKDGTIKDERVMMVDLNSDEQNDELENVIDYFKKHFHDSSGNIMPIFRFVCTHPHHDHICGLQKLVADSDIRLLNFWDLEHSFEPEDFSGHPTHRDDWEAYLRLRKSESSPKVIRTSREDSPRLYWDDNEDRISILSPSKNLVRHAHYTEDGSRRSSTDVEIDEMSYALVIQINDRKVLLAADGRESPFWDDVIENCEDQIHDCCVLKAGHHGHEAGFSSEAVRSITPEYVIFSNSSSEDRDHGAADKYAKSCPSATILKTCDEGTIVLDVPFDVDEEISIKRS